MEQGAIYYLRRAGRKSSGVSDKEVCIGVDDSGEGRESSKGDIA